MGIPGKPPCAEGLFGLSPSSFWCLKAANANTVTPKMYFLTHEFGLIISAPYRLVFSFVKNEGYNYDWIHNLWIPAQNKNPRLLVQKLNFKVTTEHYTNHSEPF